MLLSLFYRKMMVLEDCFEEISKVILEKLSTGYFFLMVLRELYFYEINLCY